MKTRPSFVIHLSVLREPDAVIADPGSRKFVRTVQALKKSKNKACSNAGVVRE